MGLIKRSTATVGGIEARLPEQRAARREDITIGVSTFVELPSGEVLEGAVRDISDRGAKIAGITEGLIVGELVRVVFVIQADQKVAYQCRVKHVRPGEAFYGVEFASKPETLDPEYRPVGRAPATPEAVAKGCPACQGELELGHVPEHVHLAGDREALVQSSWAPGRPSRVAVASKATPRPSNRRRIDTYRCTQCGRLEFYAVDLAG